MSALDRGDDDFTTGRYIVTYKDGALEQGLAALRASNMRVADTRDFVDHSFVAQDLGDADAVLFPELGCALIGGEAFAERAMTLQTQADDPAQTIEPEYFAFAERNTSEYLRGFMRAAEAIAQDLLGASDSELDERELEPQVLGATWGLTQCKVPLSVQSGMGISVAVLDTGMDLGHPDFAGRTVVTSTFVGEPVQDLHSHGTHCIGTACGPKAPPGTTPRYGIGYNTKIYVGKVLTNAGSGTTAGILAGINWAVGNKCAVISMSLGSNSPVQAAYTAAGRAALQKGSLIIAAAGNSGGPTGAPANSPTIMSVASLDPNLKPSSFSSFGKVEIAAPGRDVFSSVPRPTRYGTKSGTSMATPHVAGCAALWAQTNPTLRGLALWKKLTASAKSLPFPASKVGAGLVQAP
ncbi:MAG TPA: S8 family serine peptidase [Polyangiales bacterium]